MNPAACAGTSSLNRVGNAQLVRPTGPLPGSGFAKCGQPSATVYLHYRFLPSPLYQATRLRITLGSASSCEACRHPGKGKMLGAAGSGLLASSERLATTAGG